MKYSNSELFNVSEEEYQKWLDENITPREFFKACEEGLLHLIAHSVKGEDWMDPDVKHLRNYRIKAVKFYQEKRGIL